MNDSTGWSQKVAGDVAAVLFHSAVDVDGFKVADLLMSCNKVFANELSNFRI